MLRFGICVCLLAGFSTSLEPFTTGEPTTTIEPTTTTEPAPPATDYSDYMFSINKKGQPICAGSVVEAASKRIMMVTAARCVFRTQASILTVSTWKKSDPAGSSAAQMTVDLVITHPYYMPPSLDYDVALLKVRTNQTQGLKEFVLKKSELNLNDSIQAVELDFRTKGTLNVLKATAETRKSCQAKLGSYPKLSGKMMCATPQQPDAALPEGTPLVLDNELVGVGFYGLKDSEISPKIFTHIANSEIYSFIEKYI